MYIFFYLVLCIVVELSLLVLMLIIFFMYNILPFIKMFYLHNSYDILILEAHPIDPSLLNCCYTADNNDWSHRQQPRYQCFVESPVIIEHKKESSNQGMLIEKHHFYTCIV